MKFFLLSVFLLCSCWVSAQQVITSQGVSFSNSNGSIDWTLGETIVNADIGSGSNVLVDDFTKPLKVANITAIAHGEFLHVDVFPNPVAEILTIRMRTGNNHYSYRLLDVTGKELSVATINKEETRLSLLGYAPGIYVLILSNRINHSIKTFSIIKK